MFMTCAGCRRPIEQIPYEVGKGADGSTLDLHDHDCWRIWQARQKGWPLPHLTRVSKKRTDVPTAWARDPHGWWRHVLECEHCAQWWDAPVGFGAGP
jgi:hypothetical protein